MTAKIGNRYDFGMMAGGASTYRNDVDGLRAVAVLAIIAFHFRPAWMPGGFVGVDMFFVISGFLITRLILKGRQDGTFRLPEFYKRRILRILPALTAVVVVSLAVGQAIMLPKDFLTLSYSAMAAQLWAANIYFTYFLDTGYFADASILQPLLHLWSLGVEEQFYLIWPMALLFGLRRAASPIFWRIVAGAAAASFIAGQILTYVNPEFAYYMLPSRAGQFLAGGMVAALLARRLHVSGAVYQMASAGGGALIIGSLAFLAEDSAFPGFNALPVTIGTAALIFGGAGPANALSAILSLQPMRFVGRISYSLYLWHWPVLSFWWYLFGKPDIPAMLALVLAVFTLSVASYYLVEERFRHQAIRPRVAALRYLAIPAAAICAAAIGARVSDGYGLYAAWPEYKAALTKLAMETRAAPYAPYVCQAPLLNEKRLSKESCVLPIADTSPDMLLWGDSNASHYVGVLAQAAEEFSFTFRNAAHSSCPPVFDRPERFAKRPQACAESVRLVTSILPRYPTIALSASWPSYIDHADFEDALAETILRLSRTHKVLVIGKAPVYEKFDRNCESKRLKVPAIDCRPGSVFPMQEIADINRRVAAIATANGASYLDFNHAICTGMVCSGYLAGTSLYFDSGHWNVEGSRVVGRHLRERREFSSVLEEIGVSQAATNRIPCESGCKTLENSGKVVGAAGFEPTTPSPPD